MTEKQKKIALIAVTLIVALILLLTSKRTGGNTIINQNAGNDLSYTIPGNNIPDRSGGLVINIPGLPSYTPYSFSPISPCMCNGADTLAQQANIPGLSLTFVTNQGSSGPNIYNYTAPAPTRQVYYMG